MFLNGWKHYSLKSKLQKGISRPNTKFNKDQNFGVGILCDSQGFNEEVKLMHFAERIFSNSENELFVYSDKKIKTHFSESQVFSNGDFSLSGKIKNESLSAFVEKPFKLLISYYRTENVFLDFVATQSRAIFKTGLATETNLYKDLIIDTDLKDIDLFENELLKYLKILNRIE